jgi:hypothetical protein
MRKLLSVFLLCLLIIGCTRHKKIVSKAALLQYVNHAQNGLVKVQHINDVDVQVSFQPSSLLVAQELETTKRDTATIHSLEKKYDSCYYFLLKYSKNNKELIRQLGSYARYSDMLQVLAFQMGDYINLSTPTKDKVALGDYAFEQNYGIGDGNMLLLAFSKSKLNGANELDINIGECGFNLGELTFSFQKSDIEEIPQLDYTKIDD